MRHPIEWQLQPFEAALPGIGAGAIAVAIMMTTSGCINGMVLSGSRAYFARAEDGVFFEATGKLNRAGVPGPALLAGSVGSSQCYRGPMTV